MLEKAKTEMEAQGEFESEHPGYCGAQAYQQTFIDAYTKVSFAKLYDRKTPHHGGRSAQRPCAAVLRGARCQAAARAD
jgi:hypothetical protein